MMKTFSIGGIHPSDSKISKDCKIEVLPVPSKVFISVAQHLGAPATPVVKAGDQVKVGQVIAEPAGFISAYVHSSVSGTVKSGWLLRRVCGRAQLRKPGNRLGSSTHF